MFCGEHLLAARLRRSNIDASAGAVEEVERLVRRVCVAMASASPYAQEFALAHARLCR